jgi:hypothetical protein
MAADNGGGQSRIEQNRVLAENVLKLLENMAAARGNATLVAHAADVAAKVRTQIGENCVACRAEVKQETAEFFFLKRVPRAGADRRKNFLLRLLCVQFSDVLGEVPPFRPPSLPRAAMDGYAAFLEKKLGLFAQAELNADSKQLLDLYPDESDGVLRDLLFVRPEARVVTVKVLFNVLLAITDWPEARAQFKKRVGYFKNGRAFDPTDEHFQFVHDRLFAKVLDFMQQPARAQEIEKYFGDGATERLMRNYDDYSHMLAGS